MHWQSQHPCPTSMVHALAQLSQRRAEAPLVSWALPAYAHLACTASKKGPQSPFEDMS